MKLDHFLWHLFEFAGANEAAAIARQLRGGAAPVDPWPATTISSSHTHYSVGMVQYPQDNGFRRRNLLWTGSVVLVLVDFYEKADPPDLEPTYKIQTKPGSEQWGYAFDGVMRDADEFETLVKSCVEAGLGDKGATGRIRLARLPGSRPPGKAHSARLISADFDRRFPTSTEWFIDRLKIPVVKAQGSQFRQLQAVGWTPGPDPLLNWLGQRGVILGQPMGAWWPIRCPWQREHTGGDNTGTRYHSPEPSDIRRAFACHHGHCRHRKFSDFVAVCNAAGAPRVTATATSAGDADRLDKLLKTLPADERERLNEIFGKGQTKL